MYFGRFMTDFWWTYPLQCYWDSPFLSGWIEQTFLDAPLSFFSPPKTFCGIWTLHAQGFQLFFYHQHIATRHSAILHDSNTQQITVRHVNQQSHAFSWGPAATQFHTFLHPHVHPGVFKGKTCMFPNHILCSWGSFGTPDCQIDCRNYTRDMRCDKHSCLDIGDQRAFCHMVFAIATLCLVCMS